MLETLVSAGASLLGGILGSRSAKKSAAADRQLQLDTLKNQIQWRVEDSQKAGVHPLFGLGASPYQFQPVGDGGAGGIISDAGQNIGRAITSMRSKRERGVEAAQTLATYKMNAQLMQAQIEHQRAQTDYIRSEIARKSGAQMNPPRPDPSAAAPSIPDSAYYAPRPQQSTRVSRNTPGAEAGPVASVSFGATRDGGLVPIPAEDMHDRVEDTPMDWDWFIRYRALPFMRGIDPPSTRDHPLPRGQVWRWDWDRQAFYPFDPLLNRWYGGQGGRYANDAAFDFNRRRRAFVAARRAIR